MANQDPVAFTRDAADRIAAAVRKVEIGDRSGGAISFDRVWDEQWVPRRKVFRVATFTGAWSIDGTKTVTFRNQTTTPNTVSATNLFLPLPDGGTSARDCAIAKDGTAWYLFQAKWDAAELLSSATLSESALEFTRISGASLGTAATVQIAITTCSTAAS